MKKNFAKRMVAAAILTSWLVVPASVFAAEYKDGSAANGGAKNVGVGETFSVEANSSFEHNTSTAQNQGGGAIYSNGGIVQIGSGTSFNENYLNQPVPESNDGNLRSAGGAIASWNGGTVEIGENVSFTNNGYNSNTGNAAWSCGGAIYVDTNGVDLSRLTIGEGSSFNGNVAGSLGGAIYAGDSDTHITSTVFEGNKASSWGGAIFAGQYYNITGNKVTIDGNSSFKNNEAGRYGGAIASQYTTLNIGDSSSLVSFDGNKAGIDGGAIHITTDSDVGYQASTSITNTSFTNNEAKTGSGGAIYNPAANMTLENVSFGQLVTGTNSVITGAINGNTAGFRGGAIYNYGGTVNITNSNGSIIFAGNHAGSQGGAISNNNLNDPDSVASFTIGDNAIFVNNTSGYEGGAISNVTPFADGKAQMTIGNNALFQGNKSGMQGGAVHNQRAELTIGNDSKFYNNTAVGYGGGAIYQETDNGAASVKIGENAEFIQNSSTTSHGGAVMNFNAANGAELTIDKGAIFTQNSAGKAGGAVSNWGGNVSIGSNAEFSQNHAATKGGAIHNETYGGRDGNLSIGGNTTFTGNIADELGGAVYNAGLITLDTTDGDITFTDNKAGGVANDIFMATNSTLSLNGANKVSIGGGISGEAGSTAKIINNGANLVLEQGSKNAGYLGNYTQNSGTTDVNSEFFGGTSTIVGGLLNLNDNANIVGNSKVVLSDGTSVMINNDPDNAGTVAINGAIESASNGNGSITLGGGHLVINGDQSGFTGTFDQNGDLDTTTTISSGAVFFGGDNKINSGKLIVEDGAKLASDVEITDYSVALSLGNREFLLSDGGIKIDSKDPSTQYSIYGSLNLEDTQVKVDEATGLQSDLYIANGSTISNAGVAPSETVVIGGGGNNVTLSLGSGASTGNEQKLQITSGSTINLTPNSETGSLHLHAAIESAIEGDGTVLVEGTEMKAGAGKYDVGNILISSNNDKFTGNYIQNDGTVTLDKGAVFFGGTNKVNTDTTAGTSGSLILSDGALLANDININGNNSSSIFELASVEFKGNAGDVTQSNITSGKFSYAAIEDASGNGVNVNNAAAVFQNNTIITELDQNANALVLNTNMGQDEGVRFLGFGQGSGVEGNINLGSGTGVGYLDGAYIKDDSTLTMNNADLVFGNDKTNINYNPIIVGNGNISMVGNGTTSISSGLNRNINILAESGVLNLNNASTAGLGNVFVGDYENTTGSGYDKTGAVVNVLANKTTVGEIKVFGENARLNFNGDITGTNATVKEGTLGIYGQSSLSSLSLGSTLDMLGNNQINNLDVANLILTDNSKYMFDVDPRTLATDTINASAITSGQPNNSYQMIIAGINFTRSPIDRNVQFDIANMISEQGDGRYDLIKMPDGGVISNSAMGQYLITSSGEGSPILNASLLALNPQMYRGQVSTLASWQNQLVVNNMLFDHMDVLTRQLMNEQKTANKYAAAYPQFAPYQYDLKGGSLWYKAYGNFERLSMTKGLSVGNNAYGSLVGADFPLINLKNGWKLVPTAYIAYNGAHQTYNGVSMYQNGAQLGFMGTAYKGDFITSLLAYGGGYANDISVRGQYGGGSDTTGNWFAGVASKSAYNIRLPHNFILQPTAMVTYNAFGSQNWGSSFGAMSMSSGMLNGLNAAPGFNLIWQKKTFSLYATAQMVYNVMGQVDGRAGNVDLGNVRMRHSYFEYGLGAMKTFKDRFTGYLQVTFRNGGRTGVGFQGGLQWKIGKE